MHLYKMVAFVIYSRFFSIICWLMICLVMRMEGGQEEAFNTIGGEAFPRL
jgi:hypothetical protein